jgi:signal transduction histidine kinase
MLFCVVLRDASEQKRREQHEHLLAVAGARLAGSLEFDETLRVAVEIAVPLLADWCLLDVIQQRQGEERTIRRVASVHRDPSRDPTLRALELGGLDWDSPSAVIDVLRTGEPLLVAEVDTTWLEARADTPQALATADALDVRSLVIVPLFARDVVFGAMTIGRAAGRPPFDQADLDLARAIGYRTALAIDNAAHYRDERRATMARDEMLAIVSHDLRNPANAISMCAQALVRHPPESAAERDSLLSTIEESAEWMRRLMQDLVDVASIEAGRLSVQPEPQSVEPIIAATVEMFAARAKAAQKILRDDLPKALPLIEADRSRVMQVLANLVDNALKFTQEGGSITISAVVGDGEVEFTVRDSGAGIPAEHVPHLFDRFWHARGKSLTHGSGLGLAIARGIVAAHGGRIWVETTLGEGSAFRFTLPLAA